jgi:hypothetical protein
MNVQQITARAERLYFRLQQTPWRQLMIVVVGAFFGLAYARFSTTAFQITTAPTILWLLFIGPFLGAYLPFSDRIRKVWHQCRERRRQIGYVAVQGPFWIGVGLALFGFFDGLSAPLGTENFPFCVGVALIACTPFLLLC